MSDKSISLIFFGTPYYVLPILEILHKEFKSKFGESPIKAVVTQAPKPSGRKKEITYSPVDTFAHKRGIAKFYNPQDIIKNKIRADLGVLASFGKIIPVEVTNWFQFGILNVHPSLLPLWRGASPVQATIISESPAGVSIIKLDEKLDHGPIVTQFKDEILPDDTSETLRNRLFERSAQVLLTLIPAYLSGKIKLLEQDHKKATYTREIKKEDAFIPTKYIKNTLQGVSSNEKWELSFMNNYCLVPNANNLNNFIRAMQPWPVAWTEIKLMVNGQWSKKRLKILKTHLEPPTIKNQLLAIDTVQLEGKNPVSWDQFRVGHPEANLS